MGVESREQTVTAARTAAVDTMQRVIDELRASGVAQDDIVTTSFSISPQTVYIEVDDGMGRHGEPRTIGYIVINTTQVKIRDLDRVGDVIDSAATAGGDLIRINSIRFTVDDPSQFAVTIREMAAADAQAKAQLYARALGVDLGQLVFPSELGSSAPVVKAYVALARAESFAASAPTPISGGDVSLSTQVQAAFAIVGL